MFTIKSAHTEMMISSPIFFPLSYGSDLNLKLKMSLFPSCVHVWLLGLFNIKMKQLYAEFMTLDYSQMCFSWKWTLHNLIAEASWNLLILCLFIRLKCRMSSALQMTPRRTRRFKINAHPRHPPPFPPNKSQEMDNSTDGWTCH